MVILLIVTGNSSLMDIGERASKARILHAATFKTHAEEMGDFDAFAYSVGCFGGRL
jgi:hypothetical protein